MIGFGRPDPTPLRSLKEKGVEDICLENIRSFADKANHNKRESHVCFAVTIGATLAAPIFILLTNDLIFGRIVPAVLSALAAAATAWLQLRKPQHLWGIYRTAQRRLESELLKYQHQLGDYKGAERDDFFLSKQLDLFEAVHERWASIIPNVDDLRKITLPKPPDSVSSQNRQ